MNRLVLVCLFGLSGCFIVPKTATTEKIVARGTTLPTARPTGFELDAQGLEIHVRASAPKACTRQRYVDVDVTSFKEASLEGPDFKKGGNPGALGVVLFLYGSMITLPISGLVTGIIIARSDDTTERVRRVVGSEATRCPLYAANVPVTFTWPSGATATLRTSSYGVVAGHVPAAEVDTGTVTVRVADLAPRSIRYSASSGRDQRWGHRLAAAN